MCRLDMHVNPQQARHQLPHCIVTAGVNVKDSAFVLECLGQCLVCSSHSVNKLTGLRRQLKRDSRDSEQLENRSRHKNCGKRKAMSSLPF